MRELILAGDFAAGARLGEAELAERLGVSRTPVLEALFRLAAEGLVEIVPLFFQKSTTEPVKSATHTAPSVTAASVGMPPTVMTALTTTAGGRAGGGAGSTLRTARKTAT